MKVSTVLLSVCIVFSAISAVLWGHGTLAEATKESLDANSDGGFVVAGGADSTTAVHDSGFNSIKLREMEASNAELHNTEESTIPLDASGDISGEGFAETESVTERREIEAPDTENDASSSHDGSVDLCDPVFDKNVVDLTKLSVVDVALDPEKHM